MSPYEKTLARLEEKGIIFITDHDSIKTPALGLKDGNDLAIAMNEKAFKTDAERHFAVEHEVSHCDTDTFYNERTSSVFAKRLEWNAVKKTVLKIVPFEKVVSAYKCGMFTELEQAEEWGIPIWRVKDVHDAYEELYPDKVNELKRYIAESFDY